ncbi:CDP-diacylglycerol--glycerol-3-phosphate 3-phosphatidyltransferase [Candidatus Saccharibacteria bacterium]|nr:CDP-diacylglycerol--glycerol-3-phosphate 3-phosphatidyltransferase [Candidatus Saccharibacteria bacterium]
MAKKKPILTGPTILTIIRIVLVLPLMILIFQDNLPAKIIALICFIIASVTDFIDGRWARKTHSVTDLGAFLDPLADKMLINLTFLALVYLGVVPLWIFAIVLVRDFAVDGMRMVSAKNGTTISASIFGKIKTMVQMITLALIIFNLNFNNNILSTINIILLYIVIILTVFSGADYLTKGWKQLTK